MYSGLQEYMITDIYNWGFGVNEKRSRGFGLVRVPCETNCLCRGRQLLLV